MKTLYYKKIGGKNMLKRLIRTLFVAGAAFSLAACGSDEATNGGDNYPQENIEIYVPFNPGGPTDNSARIMAEEISEILGVNVTIINQTGGGGSTAMNSVISSNSPGYQLFYGHQAVFTGMATGQIEYELSDLTPLTTFSSSTQALVVSSDSGWEDLNDLVEDAKSYPGEYTLAADFGGATHFMGGMLLQAADIDIQMLEAGSEAERMSAILGGQIDMTFTSGSNAAEYQASGDFTVLAVFADGGEELLPDVPSASEQGFDIDFPITHVLYGPAGLDENIVSVWEEATEQLTQKEEYIQSLGNIGHQHDFRTQEETMEFIDENYQYIDSLKSELGY
ncbi:Bug family tripartite tricarboxylate transporter substrate binding protein [Halalkalibacter oceani]|uniref:Bug family tripartite tricarboxylate transporter substrate binding protein n=1 Tax=Halalkalibacter oceani TaxID=1653776 RepID=UPI0033908345